mmetsp:Transcript_6400/g.15679  ORF Transcript_6400/g.15679 Transcript_6400/m.15679 type:complete len:208 (+) Transcript_6400:353-976(+)
MAAHFQMWLARARCRLPRPCGSQIGASKSPTPPTRSTPSPGAEQQPTMLISQGRTCCLPSSTPRPCPRPWTAPIPSSSSPGPPRLARWTSSSCSSAWPCRPRRLPHWRSWIDSSPRAQAVCWSMPWRDPRLLMRLALPRRPMSTRWSGLGAPSTSTGPADRSPSARSQQTSSSSRTSPHRASTTARVSSTASLRHSERPSCARNRIP